MKASVPVIALCFAFSATGLGAPAAAAPAGRDCCFKTVEQAQPFFPPASGEIRTVIDKPASGAIACGENSVSNFSRRYALRKSEFVVRLFDYCSKPEELKADFERRYQTMKKHPVEFKDLDGQGAYRGFALFDKKNKTSYLLLMVDGRFKLQIQGFEAAALADILQIFEFLPVQDIGRFGK